MIVHENVFHLLLSIFSLLFYSKLHSYLKKPPYIIELHNMQVPTNRLLKM